MEQTLAARRREARAILQDKTTTPTLRALAARFLSQWGIG